MRKNKRLIVLLLPLLLILPFGNFAAAQTPGYVGVAAGEQYTWKARINFGNVDELLSNARDIMVDWKANLPLIDLGGLESMTVGDIYQEIAEVYLDYVLPTGWESMNITDLITATFTEYIEQFNATFLAGMIPSNWLTLNFTDFYNLAVEGINSTLYTPAWFDNPLPELFKLAINELNSTILFGLIPAGWEVMTIGDLIETIMKANTPPLAESMVVNMMIDTLLSLGIPTDMIDDTISDLIDQLMAMVPAINATDLFDSILFGMNTTMPGIESETMANVLDEFGDIANSTMPAGYGALNASTLLETVIENDLIGIIYPPEFAGMTYIELLNMSYTQAIDALNTVIIPEWINMYAGLQGMGMTSYEVGLRVKINTIGTEIEAYPGGPRGVPISMNYSVSMDMVEWMDISTLTGIPGGFGVTTIPFMFFGTMNGAWSTPFSVSPYIVDPSTYSIVQTALADQMIFTNALVVANNYDWASINPEMVIPTTGNADAIVMSAAWNTKGVLSSASVKTDGLVVASITLVGAEGEIPGYETLIIVGVASISLIAIIYTMKRKKKIIN
ncbi:MAG: hypothetical protein ACW972_03015 [Promethearchaeota archaeon]|jgi:hypothetical protein